MTQRSEEIRIRRNMSLLLLLSGLFCLCLTVSSFRLPFNVALDGTYETGEGEILVQDVAERDMIYSDGEVIVRSEDRLQLTDEDSGRLELIEESNAYAYFNGQTIWRLSEAERRGTFWEHIADTADSYTITIEHILGTVIYDFSNATPSLSDLDITIQLPDGNYRPVEPCFQISVLPMAGDALPESVIATLPCRTDSLRQTTEPLPSLTDD